MNVKDNFSHKEHHSGFCELDDASPIPANLIFSAFSVANYFFRA